MGVAQKCTRTAVFSYFSKEQDQECKKWHSKGTGMCGTVAVLCLISYFIGIIKKKKTALNMN